MELGLIEEVPIRAKTREKIFSRGQGLIPVQIIEGRKVSFLDGKAWI